jgi:hypothetical protein
MYFFPENKKICLYSLLAQIVNLLTLRHDINTYIYIYIYIYTYIYTYIYIYIYMCVCVYNKGITYSRIHKKSIHVTENFTFKTVVVKYTYPDNAYFNYDFSAEVINLHKY